MPKYPEVPTDLIEVEYAARDFIRSMANLKVAARDPNQGNFDDLLGVALSQKDALHAMCNMLDNNNATGAGKDEPLLLGVRGEESAGC